MEQYSQADENQWKVREIKMNMATEALCDVYGPLHDIVDKFSVPNDPKSDLILHLDFGGVAIKLSCGMSGDPIIEILSPENKKKGPQPIRATDFGWKYEQKIDAERDSIQALLKGV